jgi:predicted Zn-dependent protease
VVGPEELEPDVYFDPHDFVVGAFRNQSLRRDAGYGEQVDIQEVLWGMMRTEPYQDPHFEVLVMNHDLNARGQGGQYMNFVFGATLQHEAMSVQSIARLLAEVAPGRLREEMVRRLLRHETGHMFGLPTPGRRNTEEMLGAHCTNVCAMRQGMSVPEWAKNTVEEYNAGVHFCDDCQTELNAMRGRYLPLPEDK